MQALAQEVACYLGLDLSSIKIKRFADGEIYVQVQVSRLQTFAVCFQAYHHTVSLHRSSRSGWLLAV